jgi:hypothetical protein
MRDFSMIGISNNRNAGSLLLPGRGFLTKR